MERHKTVAGVLTGAFAIFVAVTLLFGGIGGSNSKTPVVLTAEGCDPAFIATAQLYQLGFSEGQFVVGEAQIVWDAPEANEAGGGAFGSAANSAQEWVEWLGSEEEAAPEARAFYAEQAHVSQDQVLVASYWVPFQFSVDTEWPGNTQWHNGEVSDAGTRHSQSGDVGWFFVNPVDCQAVHNGDMSPEDAAGAWGRSGCKNPQKSPPTPVGGIPPKEGPPPTTVTVPPTSPPVTTPPTTVPEGGKDDRKSPVSSDPDAPDQRDRTVVTAPPTVIRPPEAQPTQPPPPSTLPENPPEVSNPEPIGPGPAPSEPSPVDPGTGNDSDGDGIPD